MLIILYYDDIAIPIGWDQGGNSSARAVDIWTSLAEKAVRVCENFLIKCKEYL